MADRVVTVPDSLEIPADVKVPSARLSDSTAAGRALLAGADAAAQRASLGLGTAATHAHGDYATAAQGAEADAAATALAGRLSEASLSSTIYLPWFTGVPLYIEGDSYAVDDPAGVAHATPSTTPFRRLAARWRTATPTNTAAGGARSDQILSRILTGYPVNRAGIVGLGDLLINDTNADLDAIGGPATSARTCRAIFEYLSARAKLTIDGVSFAFDANWSSGVSSTPGALFNLAFSGDAVVLLLVCESGDGATLTVADEFAETVVTIETGGYTRAIIGSVRLDGFGAGDHEITATLISGTASIVCAVIPGEAATAPLIIWDKPGKRRWGSIPDARLATYQAAVQPVANEFANVLPVDMGEDWDVDTMIGPDLGHRNDFGNAFAAQRIHKAVVEHVTGYRQGINLLVNHGAHPAYTPVVATVIIPVYSADTFTRGNSATVGETEIGGFTWTDVGSSDFEVYNNVLRVVTVGTLPICCMDDGEADGTLSVKLASAGNNGLAFRLNSAATEGYMLYQGSGTYRLMKRSGSAWTLVEASAVTQAAGDILSVVLDGSSVTCKVNGTTAISLTVADYQSNTIHGVYIAAPAGYIDNWQHTGAL